MTTDGDCKGADPVLSDEERLLRLRARRSPAHVLREELFKDMLNLELRQQYLAVRTRELASRDARQAFAAQSTTLLLASLVVGLNGGMVIGATVAIFDRWLIAMVYGTFGFSRPPTNPVDWLAGGALAGVILGAILAFCFWLVVTVARAFSLESPASRLQRQIGPLPWGDAGRPNVTDRRTRDGATSVACQQDNRASPTEYAAEASIQSSHPKPPAPILGRRILIQPWFVVGATVWTLFAIAEFFSPFTPTELWVVPAGVWAFFVLLIVSGPEKNVEASKWLRWLTVAALPMGLLARHVLPLRALRAMARAVEAVTRTFLGD